MQTIKRTEHDIYPYISATGRLAGAAHEKKVLITGGGKGIGRVNLPPVPFPSGWTTLTSCRQ